MPNNLLNQQPQICELSVLPGGKHRVYERPTMQEKDISNLQNILQTLGGSNMMDNEWTLTLRSATSRHKDNHADYVSSRTTVVFPPLEATDAQVIRACVLHQCVNHAATRPQKLVDDAMAVLVLLQGENVQLENCRTAHVQRFIKKLSAISATNSTRNALMNTLSKLLQICQFYGLMSNNIVVDCSYRWSEEKRTKCAPDSATMEELDSFFFDIEYEIPTVIRAVYLLLRLISNRIGEVLRCLINCIEELDDDCFSVVIPSSKTEPFGQEVEHAYSRRRDKWPECVLYETLRQQQKIAQSVQKKLSPSKRGYIMVGPDAKILTESEFNDYLRDICIREKITTVTGDLAVVTSHDLRHKVISERLASGDFSVYEVMRESLHTSPRQTLAYGSASVYDSVRKQAESVDALLSNLFGEKGSSGVSATELSATKYQRLRDAPLAKVLPDQSLCCDLLCQAKVEQCAYCDKFNPDPSCSDTIRNLMLELSGKIDAARSAGAQSKDVAVLMHLYNAYAQVIARIDGTDEKSVDALTYTNAALKIVTWNVNGIRSIFRRSFPAVVKELNADIICIQETKTKIEAGDFSLPGYYLYAHNAQRLGYSGTAIYVRYKPRNVMYGIGWDDGDNEGRAITLEYDTYFVLCIYSPALGDDLRRLSFRENWDAKLAMYIRQLSSRKNVIVCGDFNVAAGDADVYSPELAGLPGCTSIERHGFLQILQTGLVDTYRFMHQAEEQKFSWWNYKWHSRLLNRGMRLDYILCSACLSDRIISTTIKDGIHGSDHCPVELVISL